MMSQPEFKHLNYSLKTSVPLYLYTNPRFKLPRKKITWSLFERILGRLFPPRLPQFEIRQVLAFLQRDKVRLERLGLPPYISDTEPMMDVLLRSKGFAEIVAKIRREVESERY